MLNFNSQMFHFHLDLFIIQHGLFKALIDVVNHISDINFHCEFKNYGAILANAYR